MGAFVDLTGSVNLISLGVLLLISSMIFVGLAIQFFQLRELLRLKWMEPYRTCSPPSKRPASVLWVCEEKL